MNDAASGLFRHEPPRSILPWSRETARMTLTQWKHSGLLSNAILYPAGTRIFKHGAESPDAFLLERGVVAFENEPTGSAKDRSGIFALCLPGHLFGQSADVITRYFTHSAIALTPCSVYRIKREKILQALQEGGEIRVIARVTDGELVVCVIDNGPGVPVDLQQRIFEPFFTTKPIGQGTGLGLDIALRVVRQAGGLIALSSKPGHTEFRVALPLKPRVDESATGAAA